MSEFAFLPEWVRLSASLLAAVCVLLQCCLIVQLGYRQVILSQKLAVLREIFALVLVLAYAALLANVQYYVIDGYFPAPACQWLRWNTAVAFAALCVCASLKNAAPWALLSVLPALALLPGTEALCGRGYPAVYLLSLVFLLLRSIQSIAANHRVISSDLSAASVRQAIDALHTGILFCYPDGYILLGNRRMRRLMLQVGGQLYRSGTALYADVVARWGEGGGYPVCTLEDGSSWMFAKKPIGIGRRQYIQVTASDVTRLMEATHRLQAVRAKLEEQGDKLKDRLGHMMEYSQHEALLLTRTRTHDLLGQRLTLLLRTLRYQDTACDCDELAASCQSLSDDLRAEATAVQPDEALAQLQKTFASIGITVALEGRLPAGQAQAEAAADIIREAVTNAVRHALATRIDIQSWLAADGHHLMITDNGTPHFVKFAEGSGIGGMRAKAEALGGSLQVVPSPRFTIYVLFPGGENE